MARVTNTAKAQAVMHITGIATMAHHAAERSVSQVLWTK